jgi:hypothetical protein
MTGDVANTGEAPEVCQYVAATRLSRHWIVGTILAFIAAIVFFKTTKATMHDFDYTARIASASPTAAWERATPLWTLSVHPLARRPRK